MSGGDNGDSGGYEEIENRSIHHLFAKTKSAILLVDHTICSFLYYTVTKKFFQPFSCVILYISCDILANNFTF